MPASVGGAAAARWPLGTGRGERGSRDGGGEYAAETQLDLGVRHTEEIDTAMARDGGTIDFRLRGIPTRLVIPPGTRTGKEFCLRGHGLPGPAGAPAGD